MQIKVSDYIAEFLRIQGMTHVFEMAGGMITHLLDSLYRLGQMDIISVHHEQAASFAADAYGRCTGKPGVALATSGPGATNLLTGIASCFFDSSPALFITGQVNSHEQKGDRNIRQLGFQETDIIAMAQSVTKKCFRITHANQVESALKEAYQCAISDRPGPVLIDIPMNIQREIITISPIQVIEKVLPSIVPFHQQIDALFHALENAKKPLLLVGRGVQCAFAKKALLSFVDQVKVPVVTSLLALDVIPYDHPYRVGMIGSYGNRWANLSIGLADLIIVIGSRLDIRQTGADVDAFRQHKTLFHIDCDAGEINNRIKGCIPIVMDSHFFLTYAMTRHLSNRDQERQAWMNEINQLKNTWPDTLELNNITGINPNDLMHRLSKKSQNIAGFVADVGNHQMWAAQSLELNAKQFFMTSGGMGAMGFALPAAISASLVFKKCPVVVIAGDGGFQLNIQELQTAVRNRLLLKIIVLNNQSLGMIRQFQDSYFEGRYQSTYWGYSAPDFSAIAMAYGMETTTISKPHELDEALTWLCDKKDQPVLLQVMIDAKTNVYPKIAFGRPITEMEPDAKPMSMEST